MDNTKLDPIIQIPILKMEISKKYNVATKIKLEYVENENDRRKHLFKKIMEFLIQRNELSSSE